VNRARALSTRQSIDSGARHGPGLLRFQRGASPWLNVSRPSRSIPARRSGRRARRSGHHHCRTPAARDGPGDGLERRGGDSSRRHSAALGIMVAATPNHAIQKDGVTILWSAGSLARCRTRSAGARARRALERGAHQHASGTGRSQHGRTVFRITDAAAAIFSPRMWHRFSSTCLSAGSCAQSLLGHVGRFCMQSMRHPASIFTLRVASP